MYTGCTDNYNNNNYYYYIVHYSPSNNKIVFNALDAYSNGIGMF